MICVAGMPRSGTSLITQMLHRCGVDLGPAEQLMPASVNNTDGYWENVRFVSINERLLAANGGTWFAPPSTIHTTEEIDDAARALIAQFDGREPWGWKDPRNALTVAFWKTLLPSVKVLVCVRHPAETASSLVASTLVPRSAPFVWSLTRPDSPVRLRGLTSNLASRARAAVLASVSKANRRSLIHEAGLELWRLSNSTVLEETTEDERLVTHYEATLSDPRGELERIVAFAGLRVPAATLDDASRVVSRGMRHQRASGGNLPADVEVLYARLCREAGYAPGDRQAASPALRP